MTAVRKDAPRSPEMALPFRSAVATPSTGEQMGRRFVSSPMVRTVSWR